MNDLRELSVTQSVAVVIRVSHQQRLFNQAFDDHLLKNAAFGTARVDTAQLLQLPTVRLLSYLRAVHFGDGDGRPAIEVGTDAPKNERYRDQRKNERRNDALGFFANLGEHGLSCKRQR